MAVSGPGITVSTVVVVDDLHVTATFAVAGGAPATARAVTVTTPGGTSKQRGLHRDGGRESAGDVAERDGSGGQADFAVLQFPATFPRTRGPSPSIFRAAVRDGCDGSRGPGAPWSSRRLATGRRDPTRASRRGCGRRRRSTRKSATTMNIRQC